MRAVLLALTLASGWILSGCTDETPAAPPLPTETPAAFLHDWNGTLTNVLVTDIVSPPVASRIYVYPNLAAYEALAAFEPGYASLGASMPGLEVPAAPPGADPAIAAQVAFSRVAQGLVFGPGPLVEREAALLDATPLPSRTVRASVAYGEAVAAAVQAFAKADHYAQTRTMPRYVVDEQAGSWQPTPPDYMEGLEPNWNRLRPFVLVDASEFTPPPPPPFDTTRGSAFFQDVLEVYHAVRDATPAQDSVARFWDCNPLVSNHHGHFVTFSKKITPGGHWIGIAGIAARTVGLDAMRTAEVYALTAVAIADGFISCWDEKYRSCLIRPETLINRHLDPDWRPVLQTPSFPEYTSGHSVVSGAASTILERLVGPEVAFVDSTEVPFGLEVRSYPSFRAAAEEAAMSRFYGGIHYRPAIEHGLTQGRAVGQAVLDRVHTRPAVAEAR